MIPILKQATIEGGKILKKYFHKKFTLYKKANDYDVVTVADKESQAAIIASIKKNAVKIGINNPGFLCEENFSLEGEYTFVIDPLDGTGNFSTGIDYFCIAVAVFKKYSLIAALILDVTREDFYWAEKGKGAYKNGKKIHLISNGSKLVDTTVVVTLPSNIENRKKGLCSLIEVLHLFRTCRIFNAIALDMANVASGNKIAVLSYGCKMWDVAAGALIVAEAGGVVKDHLTAGPLVFDSFSANNRYYPIAGNKNIIDDFLKSKNLGRYHKR